MAENRISPTNVQVLAKYRPTIKPAGGIIKKRKLSQTKNRAAARLLANMLAMLRYPKPAATLELISLQAIDMGYTCQFGITQASGQLLFCGNDFISHQSSEPKPSFYG